MKNRLRILVGEQFIWVGEFQIKTVNGRKTRILGDNIATIPYEDIKEDVSTVWCNYPYAQLEFETDKLELAFDSQDFY